MPSYRDRMQSLVGDDRLPPVNQGFDEAENAYDTLASYHQYGQGNIQSRNPVNYLSDKIKRLFGSKYPSEVGSWSYPVKNYRSVVPGNLNTTVYPSQGDHVMGEFSPGDSVITIFDDEPERMTDTAAHELVHSMGYREVPSRGKGYHDSDGASLMAPHNPKGSKFQERLKRFLQRSQGNIQRSDIFPFEKPPTLEGEDQ